MYGINFLTGTKSSSTEDSLAKRKKYAKKILNRMKAVERKYHNHEPVIPAEKHITDAEVHRVMGAFEHSSAFSRTPVEWKKGSIALVRWDKSKIPSAFNVVPLTMDEADRHYSKEKWEAWPTEFVDRVNGIIANL